MPLCVLRIHSSHFFGIPRSCLRMGGHKISLLSSVFCLVQYVNKRSDNRAKKVQKFKKCITLSFTHMITKNW